MSTKLGNIKVLIQYIYIRKYEYDYVYESIDGISQLDRMYSYSKLNYESSQMPPISLDIRRYMELLH